MQCSSATIWTRYAEFLNQPSKLGPGPDQIWAELQVISLPLHGLHTKFTRHFSIIWIDTMKVWADVFFFVFKLENILMH